MQKKVISILSILAVAFLISSCATSYTHKVGYPSSGDLFITSGDDPGTESDQDASSYIPQGEYIHYQNEAYLPFPILGIFIKTGNGEPQYVFDNKVIPDVKNMGGDALINADVDVTEPDPWYYGIIGFRQGWATLVTGTVVKR
ncbi:MAG: hypothetical protein KGY74_07715 [Candidatus Cloacimonetes bacterium]|nr:hypothetical protein [Candidatus Cloacimonadota bacterium]